ncbi:MAG: HK97 gp10 family phage protein [Clostridia bacterium]|nr:HK97 gp10 family phage protein [Clostridia bacterium]
MASYSAKQKKVNVGLAGAKELAKELREMGEKASDILSKSAMAGGKIALDDAIKNCPVRTGALKNSLKATINKVTETKATIVIDYDKSLRYGTFVELGVKGRAPNPFLRNAVDNNIKQINDAIVEAVAKGVDEVL